MYTDIYAHHSGTLFLVYAFTENEEVHFMSSDGVVGILYLNLPEGGDYSLLKFGVSDMGKLNYARTLRIIRSLVRSVR